MEWTVGAILDWTADYFTGSHIDEARLEAELLLAHVLECPRFNLHLRKDEVLKDRTLKEFKKLILERKSRKPVAYILGEQEFMGLSFKVNQHTLIPRPETELLVEEVVKLVKEGRDGIVIDLCTGSGNIPVGIAKFSPAKRIYATDICRETVEAAMFNINRHGCAGRVFPRQGDLFAAIAGESLEGQVDIIVSNPPYVLRGEMKGLAPELSFEPQRALDGGEDGMDFYRRLAEGGKKYLKRGGCLVMELNAGKSAETKELLEQNGYTVERIVKDYAGLDRIILGIWR